MSDAMVEQEENAIEPEINGEIEGSAEHDEIERSAEHEAKEDSNGEIEENGSDEIVDHEEQQDPLSDAMDISAELPSELSQIEVEPCRLCDDVSEKMFNIFEDNPEGYQLIGLIKENLPIVLYKTDPLSKQVCENCVKNLQLISTLKKQSRKTQEKYVEKLKTEGDTTDKNVLLFLGCTGSKLIDNGEDEEDEEEELKDQATSTDDLTILCVNCKTAILDASTVNADVELASDLHEIIRESLKRNRVHTGDTDSEKVLRRRKTQPLYQELDDSLCSSLTDLPTAGDDLSQYEDADVASDVESEESSDERPSKRRKIDKSSKEIQDEIDKALAKQKGELDNDGDEDSEKDNQSENSQDTNESEEELPDEDKQIEQERIEEMKVKCEEIFKEEPTTTYEPLTLMELTLNTINIQNVPDFEPTSFAQKSTYCSCKVCGEEFQNIKLLAMHEPTHMDIEIEEKIDNPLPWPSDHPFADVRNKWLTYFDEAGCEDDESKDADEEEEEHSKLLVEDTEKTMAMTKKDEVVLVDMKPMVNGVYLGDYTKEERKAFYQCMRIGGQTKRFCQLCRYCFKDNWAIESHYFSFACYYTCKYCGMRFNKQRPRFEEHVKEHRKRKDSISTKIYTASKVNNSLPKVIQPDKIKRLPPAEPEKPREIRLEEFSSPPVITKGGYEQRPNKPVSYNQQNYQNVSMIKIKEEPKDYVSSQNKAQNQAYFCRKCYKVFFKLDEFNAHSKNCDYSNYGVATTPNKPPIIKVKQEPGIDRNKMNGDVSNAGRPVRNCVRDVGPYKDEVYIPKQILNETVAGPPQSFICHICGTPFPTIYSRNSHMRIHKGENGGPPINGGPVPQTPLQQNILKQRLQQHNFQMQRAAMQQQQMQQQQRQLMRQKQMQQRVMQQQQNNYLNFDEVRVKEEPVDSFEPMVEIHEGHETSPSPPQNFSPSPSIPREIGGGAVSLTPIVKKPALNPNILKLVENNPNISLVSKKPSNEKVTPQRTNGEGYRTYGGNIIKNAGGYQGPYAPTNQHGQPKEYNGSSNYLTVAANLMPVDDKSYKCSSCWEAFSNKSHLYFHKKNQCEGSRFPCPFCKKRFGTEAAYSSHIFYSHPE